MAACISLARSTTPASVVLVAALSSASGAAQLVTFGNDITAWEWIEPAPLNAATAERLFTLYDSGDYAEFNDVIGTLGSSPTNPFEFEAHAERWIATGTDHPRRSFVVAAIALELANAQTSVPGNDEVSLARERTATQMNFVLAEVGCAFLRDHAPSPAERSWHAAFVALARARGREDQVTPPPVLRVTRYARQLDAKQAEERREHEKLLERARRVASRTSRSSRIETSRVRAEHDRHLSVRFKDDPLPAFVNAVLREKALAEVLDETLLPNQRSPLWLDTAEVDRIANGGIEQLGAVWPNRRMDRASAERLYRIVPGLQNIYDPDAQVFSRARARGTAIAISLGLWDIVDALRAVATREPVAAEASLRLGQTYARLARPDLALPALRLADSLATSPYDQYLARLFTGAVFEHAGRRSDAIAAFRGALQIVPRAQSAAIAIAPLLLELDEREEAAAHLEAAMKLPLVDDPLHYYYYGDPAAPQRAMTQLRREARR